MLDVPTELVTFLAKPLLFTDRPPDSPHQWETWYAAIRKALAHKAIAEHNSRTTPRLVAVQLVLV